MCSSALGACTLVNKASKQHFAKTCVCAHVLSANFMCLHHCMVLNVCMLFILCNDAWFYVYRDREINAIDRLCSGDDVLKRVFDLRALIQTWSREEFVDEYVHTPCLIVLFLVYTYLESKQVLFVGLRPTKPLASQLTPTATCVRRVSWKWVIKHGDEVGNFHENKCLDSLVLGWGEASVKVS